MDTGGSRPNAGDPLNSVAGFRLRDLRYGVVAGVKARAAGAARRRLMHGL